MEYINTKEAMKLLNVSSKTLRRWDKKGKIDTIRTPSNIRMYNKECIYKILGRNYKIINEIKVIKKKIIYCRVSSNKQKNDLERQIESMTLKYPNYEVIKDIGSGINFKRNGLQKLIKLSLNGKLDEVIISHRDRLCRFAFELIEWLFSLNGTKLTTIDSINKSDSDELAEDVIAIIQVFACRQMGKRRYKNKSK